MQNNSDICWSFLLYYGIFIMEMIPLEIKTGYLYHIKDQYFNVVNDENLMQNREKGKKRNLFYY